MKTKMKQLFGILLSLALVLGLMLGMSTTAFAVDASQSGENEYVRYFVGTTGYSYHGFSVQGKNGDDWLPTTYGGKGSGYETAMDVDGTTITFNDFAYGKEYTQGKVKAYITARLDEKSVLVDYTLVNNSNETKTVKIGSYGDAKIGGDDRAPCSFTGNGIRMTSIDGNTEFLLIPGDGNFTTRWYGLWSDAESNVFNNQTNTSTYNGDSGIAWSWTVEIPAGETVIKTAKLSAGQARTKQIIYDANGGTGNMDPTVDIPGESIKLNKNTFTKNNCVFQGWDTNSAGTTVVYADEATLTMPDTDTTLYAVWKENAEITAAAEGFEGAYDGKEHGITVTVTDPSSGATIKYGKTAGTYDLDASPTITNVVDSPLTVYFKVTADGYKDYTGSATVTINKNDAAVKAKDQNIKIGGTVPDLSSPVLNTHYTVTGLVGEEKLTTAPTLTYSAAPDNTKAGTYTITPDGASAGDNYTISYETGTLTITDKQPQTITAEDNVTVTYGDTGRKIEATTSGDGKLSYTVKSGDAVTVDAATGALTIVKVGTAVITVTAAETDTYAQATKDVTVTVNKEEEKPLELDLEIILTDDHGNPLVPDDIAANTELTLTINIQKDNETVSSAEVKLTVNPKQSGRIPLMQKVQFTPGIPEWAETWGTYTPSAAVSPNTVKVSISGLDPAEAPSYHLSTRTEPPYSSKIRVYIDWKNSAAANKPEVIKVYALPEDEIGAYQLRSDGTKEYLLFQTYDICMKYLGSDALCSGPERCFHK